jgi:hypothetical protein
MRLLFIFSFILFVLQFITAAGQKFMSSGSEEYRAFIQEELSDQAQRVWSSLPAQSDSLWTLLTQKPGGMSVQTDSQTT